VGYSLTYKWVSDNTYDFFLDLYRDCSGFELVPSEHKLTFDRDCGPSWSEIPFQAQHLEFTVDVSPLCASEVGSSTCSGGSLPGYQWHRLRRRITLQPCDSWRVSWKACCRHESVNLLNGFTPGMYAEVVLNNFIGPTDSSPQFVDAGVPHMCVNEPVSYNPGATDPDGNTMVFSLISARSGSPSPSELTYEPGYSGSAPIPGISINPSTGQLNFVPTIAGMYVVVIQVATYTPGGTLISTVMRDLMFVVMPCDQSAPYSAGFTQVPPGLTTGPNSIGPCDGQSFCVQMTFYDTNPNETIEVESNAMELLPTSSFTLSGSNPVVATFCWVTDVSLLPTNIYVEANDGACPIPNVSSRSILLTDCVVLPVQLVDFTAEPDGNKVRVEWATASEKENALFTVERGRTPEELRAIGSLPGAGTTTMMQHYVFHDSSPLSGLSYYRLTQTDVDGTTSHSAVVPVAFMPDGGIRVVPDATGTGWIVTLDAAVTGEWMVVDMLGRAVITGQAYDTRSLTIPAVGRAQGVSVLVLRSEFGDHRVKLPPVGGPGSLSRM
jgi:hypothetical protein